jgi:hypothetical protein
VLGCILSIIEADGVDNPWTPCHNLKFAGAKPATVARLAPGAAAVLMRKAAASRQPASRASTTPHPPGGGGTHLSRARGDALAALTGDNVAEIGMTITRCRPTWWGLEAEVVDNGHDSCSDCMCQQRVVDTPSECYNKASHQHKSRVCSMCNMTCMRSIAQS